MSVDSELSEELAVSAAKRAEELYDEADIERVNHLALKMWKPVTKRYTNGEVLLAMVKLIGFHLMEVPPAARPYMASVAYRALLTDLEE